MRLNYRHTVFACYLGIISQAIINNFAPLLFLTFQSQYGIPLSQITLLVTVNFSVQLLVDLVLTKLADRLGYRKCLIIGLGCLTLGLCLMALLPPLLPNPFVGLIIAIVLYAIGGGATEVLVSPVVEACPSDAKAAAMSLLHSFYCWGHMGVVLLSTLFFAAFGIDKWPVLAMLWALVPLACTLMFTRVPIAALNHGEKGMGMRELFKSRLFWILMLLMVCSGASEQGMSQWSSAFAESALHVTKVVGDVAGPCAFALMMGLARLLFARLSRRGDISRLLCASGILCVGSYLLAALTGSAALSLIGCGLCGFSVGAMWPGTFSLGAEKCPRGGTAMFAMFALAGDLGCSSGPTLVGFAAKASGDNLQAGLLAALVFPVLLLIGIAALSRLGRGAHSSALRSASSTAERDSSNP